MTSLNGARAKARDAKRRTELNQVSLALEQYYGQVGSYVSGEFFSVWDSNYSHSTYYWSGGNPPWSAAFYNALVGGGYMTKLPLDPGNKESGPTGYLGDGSPLDQGYIYSSDGQKYILGTNLESGGGANNRLGNYQIKGGNW